jgi:capsular polysaccharide biosynthesis protein
MRVLHILWRQRIPVAVVIGIGIVAAILASVLLPPKYQATSAVMLQSSQVTGRDPAFSPADMPTLLESSTVIDETMKQFDIRRSPDDFMGDIIAKGGFGTNVMSIQYTDVRPRRAVDVANALATNLAAYYRNITRAKYASLTAYLNTSIATRRKDVERLDHELQLAAAADPTLAGADALSTLTNRLDTLIARQDDMTATLTGSQAEAGATASQFDAAMPLVRQQVALADPLYRTLQDQYGKDAATLESQQAQYTENFPGVRGLEHRVDHESSSLARRADSLTTSAPAASSEYLTALSEKNRTSAVAAGAAAQAAAIGGEIAQVRAQIAAVPSTGVRIAALRRERDVALNAYQTLAQRREVTLADQAESNSLGATVGKHAALLAIGAVFGFAILAVTIAFLLESVDRRLRTEESIADLYGKPVVVTLRRRTV